MFLMSRKVTLRIIVLTCLMATLIITGLTAFAQNQPRNFDCSTVTDVPQSECEVLVALYNSTNGASWTTKTNWLSSTTVCTWYRVVCSDGHIVQLYPTFNNLTGTLPTFGSLPELTNLNLMGNAITGSITSSINGTNFPKLGNLSLLNNQLSGAIPTSLNTLPVLWGLNLSINNFSGPLPDMTDLCDTLSSLSISSASNIGGTFPSWINATNCPDLQSIFLNGLSMTGPFPELTGMDIFALDIGNNNFDAGPIPASIIAMPNLYTIAVGRTNRTGTIPVFASTKLVSMYVQSNNLTGNLPDEYNGTNYPDLETIYVSGLQITNFSDNIATLPSLSYLEARSNKLYRPNLSTTVLDILDAKSFQWELRQTIPPTYTASATNATTIQITGTGIPLYGVDAGSFEVLTSSVPGGPYTLATSGTGGSGTFTINLTGQTPESTVYLVVRSKTNGGGGSTYTQTVYSENGPELTVTLPEVTDPTAKPTKPVISYPGGFNDKVSGTKSPNVNWNPNPAGEVVTSYRVTIKSVATGAIVFNKVFNVADICTTFCLVSLSTQNPVISLANGAYTVQLTATNAIGSTKSNIVDFSLVKPTKPTLTAPIGGVTINDPTPTLTFTLDLFQNITDVKVTVTKDGASTPAFNQTFLHTAVCTGSNCAVTLPTALGNGLYNWKAELINVNGKSAATGEFKIAFPDKATGLAPTANATIDTQKPTLTWNEVANAAEYRVTITHTSGTKVVIDWIASGATGFVCDSGVCTLDLSAISSVPNLKKGTQEWFVEARNTTIHPQSKSKSAVAKFKIVLPVRGSTNGALPLPPDTFRAP